MTDHLVVVQITDGTADTSLVHQPAPSKQQGFNGNVTIRLDTHTFPPRTWPSACGQVQHGYVYNHAGLLQDAPVCVDCDIAILIEGAYGG